MSLFYMLSGTCFHFIYDSILILIIASYVNVPPVSTIFALLISTGVLYLKAC